MARQELEVAIIGAGLAGLACAARLRRRGVEHFALLEQGAAVGAFWHATYDRIRLHSPFHDLPDDGGLRRRFGMLLRRDELLAYLEGYARSHGLAPFLQLRTRVDAVRRKDGGWELASAGRIFRARYTVVATAANRVPVVPDLPGKNAFAGHQLHSRDYRNPGPFQGHRVLVVGSGNSAAEIALDLASEGARSVALCVRAPRHVLSLRKLRRMARVARLLRLAFTPEKLAEGHRYTRVHPDWDRQVRARDAMFARFSMDLSRYGIRRPEEGVASQMYNRARIAWYDQGTAAAIAAGRIHVIDGNRNPMLAVTEHGVQFLDGEEKYDSIVYGTGFEPGLERFLEDSDRLLCWDEPSGRHMPQTDGRSRSSVEPSLFFPGFDITVNGGLSLGLWGCEVADTIADELEPSPVRA